MRLLDAFLKDISVAERFITLVFLLAMQLLECHLHPIPFCLNAMICVAPFKPT